MPRVALWHKIHAKPTRNTTCGGVEIPACFGSVEEEYWALKRAAGVFDLSHRGRILIRGEDAPRFLHGMVTNDVQGLKGGRGNYAFMLNVQGHILSDVRIFRLDSESFVLDCEPQCHDVVTSTLDRHIIADIVELQDLRSDLACFAIEGPLARQAVDKMLGEELPGMDVYEHIYRQEVQARVVRASCSGEEGYWIVAPPERAAELWDRLSPEPQTSARPGVAVVGFDAIDLARIESGVPRYGIDITDNTLPQETGQMQAVSFSKGCYIGQEVVERIRSRGHVNRKLVQLFLNGHEEVPPETEIRSDGQAIGVTASSAYSFPIRKTIAFGYVRREYAESGKQVNVAGLQAEIKALS